MSLTRYQSMQIKRFQTRLINIILYECYCLDVKLSLCMFQFLEKPINSIKNLFAIYLEGIIKISTNFYTAHSYYFVIMTLIFSETYIFVFSLV